MELLEEPKYFLQRETDYVPFPSQLENLLNSAKYFLQRKLGVSLDILPNHEVKIAAQDTAVVAIARSELLQILATPHLLQKELEDLQRQPVHVFVDESNIFLGAQTISHPVTGNVLRDPSIRLLPDALARIVLNSRPAAQQVVVGSTHLRHAPNKAWETERWKKWQDAGFTVHSEQRAFGSGESFVDDAIVAMVNAAILRFPYRGDHAIRRTIILLTGDGNLNHGRASFIEAVEAALRSDWKVEVWSWQHAINRNYLRMLDEYAHTGLLAVQSLDVFRDLVTCHHRPSHHDQTKRQRQQRRQRQPQRTSASSRTSTRTRRGTSRSSLPSSSSSSSLSMSTSMSTKRKGVSRARKKKRSFKHHAPRHPRHATGHTVHINNEQPRRRHPSQHLQYHHPIKREASNVKAERK
jgi:hypothetical protein